MNSDLTEDQMADTEDQVELGELGMPAVGDQDRCNYTVHANGDWGDHRCELVVDHPGPHAIGLRYHAVPLIGSIIPFAADLREERDLLRKRMGELEEALKLMLASPKDRLEYCKANDLLRGHITGTESVDEYWRKVIATEALTAEMPPPLPEPPEPSDVS